MAALAHTFKSVSYSYSHIINFTAPFGVLLAQDQRYKVLLLGFNLLLHDVLYQEYFGKALIIIVLIPSKSLLQLRLNPFAVILRADFSEFKKHDVFSVHNLDAANRWYCT